MQAPIAISRGNNTNNGSTLYRSGTSSGSLTNSNGVLGSSFAGASSGSFREAIAASFGKDATE
jgi:hypothetical protein